VKKGDCLQAKEKILCIRQNRLPAEWMAPTAVVPMDLAVFIRHCTRAGHQFVLRTRAETDPGWQQVIPYIVLQTKDLGLTAVYNRQGSEKRLHDLWSLGIGGHINPRDQSDAQDSFQNILVSGMTRELDEELAQRPATDQPVFCGIINETVTDVGRVHLGAVFQIRTPSPDTYVPGPELFRFQWKDTRKLSSLNMELWSTLALDLLNRER
jgi:predicted NUDIX family phosphoesterase